MEYVSNSLQKVDEYTYKRIKDSKQPKGLFWNKKGKLISVMNNMEGKADETCFYYEKSAMQCVQEIQRRHCGYQHQQQRDINKEAWYIERQRKHAMKGRL